MDHIQINSNQDMPRASLQCHPSSTGKTIALSGTQQTSLFQMACSSATLLKACLEGVEEGLSIRKVPLYFLDQAGEESCISEPHLNSSKSYRVMLTVLRCLRSVVGTAPGSRRSVLERSLRDPESDSYGICTAPPKMGKQKTTFSIFPYVALVNPFGTNKKI